MEGIVGDGASKGPDEARVVRELVQRDLARLDRLCFRFVAHLGVLKKAIDAEYGQGSEHGVGRHLGHQRQLHKTACQRNVVLACH